MSRSSSELKRISRDILNNRYSVPMVAFLTASLIPTLIEIPFSMTLGDYPGTPQLIISTIADILILLIAQMLDTGVMLVHMNMTRGQTYRIRDVFTPFRNGAERFFLAAVLFDVFLVIAGIPAIAGVLYFYKTGVSGLSGALLAAGSIALQAHPRVEKIVVIAHDHVAFQRKVEREFKRAEFVFVCQRAHGFAVEATRQRFGCGQRLRQAVIIPDLPGTGSRAAEGMSNN